MIALLLVAFADLVAPAPRTGGLSVALELGDGRYKITHTWNGARTMRFLTGATNRWCDGPADRLLVDGRELLLGSEVPCTGMAYRYVQTIAPGRSWIIEGHVTLDGRARKVIAEYFAGRDDLAGVEPKERDLKEPPIFLGHARSAPVRVGK